jgi:hypothetical protein
MHSRPSGNVGAGKETQVHIYMPRDTAKILEIKTLISPTRTDSSAVITRQHIHPSMQIFISKGEQSKRYLISAGASFEIDAV